MTSCPCCGSEVSRPVIVSLDTNSVSTSLGTLHVTPKTAEIVHALLSKFPGSLRTEALGVAVWGNEYWNNDGSRLRGQVIMSRKALKPLGLDIVSTWGTGYRLSTSKTEGA